MTCASKLILKYLRGLDSFLLQLRSPFGVDADELSFAAFVLEFHKAFDQREQSIVFTASDIIARFPLRSTLTSQNITAKHMLAAELFQAKPLCI